MPSKNDYKPTLIQLMSFLDSTQYEADHEFTQERLLQLTPRDIERWMKKKAYGTPDPDNDAQPTEARSSSLQYWKKALSSYMPNRLMTWNVATQQGNPTKSVEVNDLIKKVKKCEVRHVGAPSQARRAAKMNEYRNAMRILMAKPQNDLMRCYLVPSLTKFQFHIIGRVDDCSQFLMESLTRNPDNDFTLRAKLRWSKNVHEERDAPNQILIGAMDSMFCALLGLAVWLEVFLSNGGIAEQTPYIFGLNEDVEVPKGGDKIKDAVSDIFAKDVFNQPEFLTDDGPLGTHSFRKFASTFCRRNGCSKDEKDHRGRWKRRGRTSDVYDDVELNWPDAKVASRLCVGGPCKYVVKEGAGVSNDFILQHVVPSIRTRFSDEIALVLGKALLWLVFSEENSYVPDEARERIRQAYNVIRQLPENVNPIEKILMVVTGDDAEVYFNEVGQAAGGDGAVGGPGGGQPRSQRDQLISMQSDLVSIRRMLAERNTREDERYLQLERRLANVERNTHRIAAQPAFRTARATDNHDDIAPPGNANQNHVPYQSTLSPTPRTIHSLWLEYETGIGGRKPARDFTREERGRVKHKYHRRKVVWDCVSRLIRAGLTANVACDRIYQVYGVSTPVTRIINNMKRDARNGTLHQLLQV